MKWNLKPNIFFYIHHKNLETFVIPQTYVAQWTIMFVEKGSFSYSYQGNAGIISGRSIFICPPNVKLTRKVIDPMTFHYMRVEWEVEDEAEFDESLIPTGEIKITDTKRYELNLAYLEMLSKKNGEVERTWANHILQDIWFLYLSEKEKKLLPFLLQSKDELMQKALEKIKEEAFKDMRIKAIADELHLSQVQFFRRFKKAFGLKPSEYVTILRMDKAKKLLIESTQTMRMIALASGFQNEYYFSTAFKKQQGMSPLAYRNKYKLI